jgi:hypothetical protein
MNKFITNPQDYTIDDLRNNEWDIVKLNITFDIEPMLEWFNKLSKDSLWRFNMKNTFRPGMLSDIRMDGLCVGDAGFWALQWPTQRSDPLPNPIFANRDQYPELLDDNWEEYMSNHLDQYYYGFYKSFVEQIGQDAWTWGRAMDIANEQGIGPHRDHDDPGHKIRLHVNIQADERATWHFGTQLGINARETWPYMDREHYAKSGDIFLVNVSNVHSPINHGHSNWKLLHSDPLDSSINRLLQSTQHISLK